MIKVVITGGAGFIGSHLAEYWINNNAEVFIIDNLRTGSIHNIEHVKKVNFFKGDIRDKDLVSKILEGADYVYNFAAIVSVPESIINPYECVDINVNGLLNILESANNPESPKTVFMKPEPKSPYGITKLDGEYYLQSYSENFNLKTTSLRFFNVFGPRQDPNSSYASAIPIFVNKALKNENIIIYGDGKQTRDFVFIKDIVAANILAVEKENVQGVFNVGTGKATSVNKIVDMVLKLTNSKSKVVYEKERSGDIKHSLSSIELTKEKLGYTPKYNLEDGLQQTIEYFIKIFRK
jgi:UDP-glucose 4-epimerase